MWNVLYTPDGGGLTLKKGKVGGATLLHAGLVSLARLGKLSRRGGSRWRRRRRR